MFKKGRAVNIVHRGNGWAVVRDGAERARRVFKTERAAIAFGRSIARREKTELRIQDRQGRWRDSDSYPIDALIDEVIEEYRPALESLAKR